MFEEKKILVVGYGKSGKAMLKFLTDTEAEISLFDKNKLTEDKVFEETGVRVSEIYSDERMPSFHDILALSPGVPTDLEFIKKAKSEGSILMGEVELAYRGLKGKVIGITGTNGKTTTTSLVHDMFKRQYDAYLAGNIGIPLINYTNDSKDSDYYITELSSYQLETIDNFKVSTGVILNLTPDHLMRHKTMENYMVAKFRIFENLGKGGNCIINHDDEMLRIHAEKSLEKTYYFSRKTMDIIGSFIRDGKIIINVDEEIELIDASEIRIRGTHNLENALAASLMAYLEGVSVDNIRNSLREFSGVEHRYEILGMKSGRRFINDSKATNPDAAMKAVEATEGNAVLIAGGQYKQNDYYDLIGSFNGKIRAMVLFGETKDQISDQAGELGYNETYKVQNLDEAVLKAVELSLEGDDILLSPACASWDMYESFEKRGEHFKSIFENLEE